MKTLLLIRHAKSSWKNPGLTDFDRPLNPRGKRDAPLMGKILKERNLQPDALITSPAKRAWKTAKLIAKAIDYPKAKIVTEELIYEGNAAQIFRWIQNIDDSRNTLILIGHNPDFTSLANYFTGAQVTNLPTCALFCIDFEINSWQAVGEGKGKLRFYDFPKKYAENC